MPVSRFITSSRKGKSGMGKINEVMTATEAAERWGIAKVTVRQACSGYKKAPPRFTAEETRQSGSTWLITVEGMQRVFGKEATKIKNGI